MQRDFRKLPRNTVVYDSFSYPDQEGKIIWTGDDSYTHPIKVRFGNKVVHYTKDGRYGTNGPITLATAPYKFDPQFEIPEPKEIELTLVLKGTKDQIKADLKDVYHKGLEFDFYDNPFLFSSLIHISIKNF